MDQQPPGEGLESAPEYGPAETASAGRDSPPAMKGVPAQHPVTGRYELRIKGHLDDRWADWFDGMVLTRQSDGTTTLCGPVIDQAALHGLLGKVRDLGATLISVQAVGDPYVPSETPGLSLTNESDVGPAAVPVTAADPDRPDVPTIAPRQMPPIRTRRST